MTNSMQRKQIRQVRKDCNRIIQKINNILKKRVFSPFLTISDGGGSYCKKSGYSYHHNYEIHLDINDIEAYATSNNLLDTIAAKAITCHEIFHVLLDHYNSKYSDYNHNIFNIACDLEVNSYINMQSPALRAADYGFPDMLTADDYYKRLITQFQDMEDKNFDANGVANNNIQTEFDKFKNNETSLIDSYRSTRGIQETLNKISAYVSRQIIKNYELTKIKGLQELLRKLERTETAVKITPHTKKSTYTKLNNRRNAGNIILPGKKFETSGLAKKYDSSLTVFLDVSGSTQDFNHQIMTIAYKLHKFGASIVYYNADLITCIEADDSFKSCVSEGGTSIVNTLETYFESHDKLHRVYIFTDGHDDFRGLENICERFSVYYINNDSIYEKFNEKKHATSAYA